MTRRNQADKPKGQPHPREAANSGHFGQDSAAERPPSQTVEPVVEVSPVVKPRKVIEPTVTPREGPAAPDPKKLPPIGRIIEPKMQHMSTKIRWYLGLGYEVGEVSRHLGIRYQQVRNVGTTDPKRAAREDVPPYEIRLADLADDIDAIIDAELERSLMAGRTAEAEGRKRRRKGEG